MISKKKHLAIIEEATRIYPVTNVWDEDGDLYDTRQNSRNSFIKGAVYGLTLKRNPNKVVNNKKDETK